MKNLIEKIACDAEINEEKARQALLIISKHVNEQFPLLRTIVDLILETKGSSLTMNKSLLTEFPKDQFSCN
jgi:hypothetical protein